MIDGPGDRTSGLAALVPPRAARQATLLLAVLVALFSVAVYAGTLKNDFVWDDFGVFVEVPASRDLRNIPGFFTSPVVLGAETVSPGAVSAERIRYYRPLTATLHAIEYRWFGTRPLGYKTVNLVLNGIVTALAFLLAQALTARTGAAFLAALLYAATPGRGEVVYWAYSDSHILMALCALLALLAYHHRRYAVSLAGMAVALLFQEGAILLPAILAGYEWLIAGGSGDARGAGRRLLPFALLAGAYLGLRHLVAGGLPLSPLPLADWLRGTAYLMVKHVQILFVPDAPVTMYLYRPGMFATGGVAGAATLVQTAVLLVAGFALWKISRSWFFWYAWFWVWIAPSFNIGGYANYLMAEKSLYLAALGPCVLLALAANALPRWRPAGVAVLLLLAGWHAGQVVARAPYWADSVTYIENMVAFEPDYDVAHYQLAILAMQAGDYRKAVERLERVVALRPDLHKALAGSLAEAYTGEGRHLAEQRRFDEALAALQRALACDPQRSATWNALGVVNYLRGAAAQAAENWRQAAALDPANAEARLNLQRYSPGEVRRP